MPRGVDTTQAPAQTVKMTARKFAFEPDEVRVKAGTMLTLEVTSVEGTHGIAIDDYGIDELLEQGQTRTIRIYAADPGEHPFHCSHLCGTGHFRMKGRIVVDR